jgi:hypothetical protein
MTTLRASENYEVVFWTVINLFVGGRERERRFRVYEEAPGVRPAHRGQDRLIRGERTLISCTRCCLHVWELGGFIWRVCNKTKLFWKHSHVTFTCKRFRIGTSASGAFAKARRCARALQVDPGLTPG